MNMDVNSKNDGDSWQVQVEQKGSKNNLQRRRYVRLDITSPVEIKLLVTPEGENSEPGLIPYKGEVLNVSAGGVLIESEDALPEDHYVVMELELNGTDRVSGIVGKVKRSEAESESCHLIGVEFCTKEDIDENCPEDYRRLLGEQCVSFTEKVRELLNKYVFNEKVNEKIKEKSREAQR